MEEEEEEEELALSIVRVLMSYEYENPDEADTFSHWNVGIFESPDACVSPRRFYWIFLPWKLQDI